MSSRDRVMDQLIDYLRAAPSLTTGQVIDGPLDHTLVKKKPLVFVAQVIEPTEHAGSGGRTHRNLVVAVSFVMPVDQDRTAPSERKQVNSGYDPIHAHLELAAQTEPVTVSITEDPDGLRFIGFGDRDRRAGVISFWNATYQRRLGTTGASD